MLYNCDSLFAWFFGGLVLFGFVFFYFQQQHCEILGGVSPRLVPEMLAVLAAGGKARCWWRWQSEHASARPGGRASWSPSRLFGSKAGRGCRESGFCKGLVGAGPFLCSHSERAGFQCAALGASMKGITAEKQLCKFSHRFVVSVCERKVMAPL